jgi:hypothetical protein
VDRQDIWACFHDVQNSSVHGRLVFSVFPDWQRHKHERETRYIYYYIIVNIVLYTKKNKNIHKHFFRFVSINYDLRKKYIYYL